MLCIFILQMLLRCCGYSRFPVSYIVQTNLVNALGKAGLGKFVNFGISEPAVRNTLQKCQGVAFRDPPAYLHR